MNAKPFRMLRLSRTIACLAGLTGVILGAFGAHALKEVLIEAGTLETWKTAVAYQMWHALALLFTASQPASGLVQFTASCFAVGILLFSGSLYWLALGGPAWLGPVTPLGGLLLILGWGGLLVAGLRSPAPSVRTS